MSEGRALLTDREKQVLSGEADVDDNYRYKVQSVVRNRLRKQLDDDVNFLAQHFGEGYDIAVSLICSEEIDVEPQSDLEAKAIERQHELEMELEVLRGETDD